MPPINTLQIRKKTRNPHKYQTLAGRAVAHPNATEKVPRYFYLREEGKNAGNWRLNRRAINPNIATTLFKKGSIRDSTGNLFVNKGIGHRDEGSGRKRKKRRYEANKRARV